MVAAGSYPDSDAFTCRVPGTEEAEPGGCDDSAAVALVLRAAQRMASLNGGCPAGAARLLAHEQSRHPCAETLGAPSTLVVPNHLNQ